MLCKIRRGTFETNSSSMHSLNMLRDEKGIIKTVKEAQENDPRFKLNKEGVLVIENSEDLDFGWGFEILTTFYEKLCYAIASICSYNQDTKEVEGMDKILDALHRLMSEIKGIELPEEEISWHSSELEPYTGEIDHQSYGTLPNSIAVDNLADFLFKCKNIVYIDNDNSSHTYQVQMADCKTLKELDYFWKHDFDPNLDDYELEYGEEEYDEEEDLDYDDEEIK